MFPPPRGVTTIKLGLGEMVSITYPGPRDKNHNPTWALWVNGQLVETHSVFRDALEAGREAAWKEEDKCA